MIIYIYQHSEHYQVLQSFIHIQNTNIIKNHCMTLIIMIKIAE